MAASSPKVIYPADKALITTTCDTYGIDSSKYQVLWEEASAAKALAYCPYSNFQVGSAILMGDGKVIVGANVENAAYPVGTCAERVAIGRAIMEGYGRPEGGQDKRFKAIVVATNTLIQEGQGLDGLKGVASPCGMCRQFIREFSSLDMPIFMFDKEGKCVVMELGQLLPLSFGPEALLPPA